jgi:16S rRNA processing protein RimM
VVSDNEWVVLAVLRRARGIRDYLSDLIGFEVFSRDERRIGTVTGWLDAGGPALLEVTEGDAEILVPLVPEICVDVDESRRRITVELPEGLEGLNPA